MLPLSAAITHIHLRSVETPAQISVDIFHRFLGHALTESWFASFFEAREDREKPLPQRVFDLLSMDYCTMSCL